MAKPIQTPGALEAALIKALEGMKTAFPANQTTIVVDGVTYAVAAFIAKLEAFIALFKAVHDAKVFYDASVTARNVIEPDAKALIAGLHAALPVILGAKNPALAKFGKAVKKTPAKPTSAVKAEAAKKTKATKTARGEIGKKARSKIKVPAKP